MADFDLSLLATLDSTQVESGAKRVEGALDGVTAAEKRGEAETKKSKTVTDETARAERERAKTLDAVRAAIEPNYAAQQRMNTLLAQAQGLHAAGAISLKQLTAVQNLHTQAMKAGAASAGQLRAASVNTGAQIQDITQTLALGINPMVVFGQQAGQLVASLAQTANTATRAGRAITFLAGPAGSVVLAAITVFGLLATSMMDAGELSDKLSDRLDFQKMTVDELTKAIKAQREEAEKSIQTNYQQAESARAIAEANLDAAIAERQLLAAKLAAAKESERVNAGQGSAPGTMSSVTGMQTNAARAEIEENKAQIAELERVLRLKEIPGARREAEAATNKATAATLEYEKAEGRLNKAYEDGLISRGIYEAGLKALYAQRDKDIAKIRETEAAQKRLNKESEKAGELAQFISPIAGGRQSSGYSESRRNPVTGIVQPHRALDIAAPAGTTVRAPQVGTVEAVGYSSTLGKYVVINHGAGTKTKFGHLSDNSFVQKGDAVEQGQTIGKVGSTGRSTGNHLHYAVEVNGKPVDPTKSKFLIDDVAVAEAAQKAADSLEDFGKKSAESIRRVTERFDEQPRFIDQAAQSARELDKIIADLSERKPEGFEQLIADAQAAKGVIADSLVRPFDQLIEASERRMQIDRLIAANRVDEAEALQEIWRLEKDLGPLSNQRKQIILDTVEAERMLADELERTKQNTDDYLSATRSVRQEVEAILAGQGKISNFKQIFKQLNAKVLTEQLFGDIFRDLEKYVKEETAIESSVDLMAKETKRAGTEAGNFADVIREAAGRVNDIATGQSFGGATPTAGFTSTFDAEFGSSIADAIRKGQSSYGGGAADDIVVTSLKNSAGGLTPDKYFGEMTKRLVKPLLDGFDEIFGTKFFSSLEGVVAGAAQGYLTGGVPGGILGGLKGIKGLGDTLDRLTGSTDVLGTALKGAQTGTMVSGIGDMLGIKNSKMGAQIGGAIGSALPIPGGEIIGAIAGGLIGGLFKKTKYGTASLSGFDDAAITSRGKGRAEGATSLGGSVTEGIRSIADALDAELGSFRVSIGTYKDSFRVSGSGKTGKLKGGDVKDFGDDEGAAIAYAIMDAIADGAVKGLSPAVEKALKSSTDVQKAVAEAVKVSELERTLKYMNDAFGAELADAKKIWDERIDLARKYGVDLIKVEALNSKERQEIIDAALDRQVGSMKKLLEDLTFGSLFEGSPTERRARLQGEIGDAKEDVSAGVAGAIERLADLERQLVETTRENFGTAGGEYAADREQAMTTAQQIIASETARIEAAAAAQAQAIALADEANSLLAGVNGRLDTLIGQGGGSGGSGSVGGTGSGAASGNTFFDSFFGYRAPSDNVRVV